MSDRVEEQGFEQSWIRRASELREEAALPTGGRRPRQDRENMRVRDTWRATGRTVVIKSVRVRPGGMIELNLDFGAGVKMPVVVTKATRFYSPEEMN